MHESALSREDAWDAGIRLRVVECAEGLRIEDGDPEDSGYDIEQALQLVWLALERGREVRIVWARRSGSAEKLP